MVVGFVVGRFWLGLVMENLVFYGCVGFLGVLVSVFGSGFVLGWLVLLMDLWVLLVVGGSGFVGFVDAVALLVVDGFVGFAGGWWLVVTGFLWVCWVGSLALWVLFFNFFFFSELQKGKREDSGVGSERGQRVCNGFTNRLAIRTKMVTF